MDGETLKSRLMNLLQKSRKAVRLYSGIERIQDRGENAEYSGMQLEQWQQINTDLMRQLTALLEIPNNRALVSELFAVRDRFLASWRAAEAELNGKQRELIHSSERGDFIKAAIVSRRLVALKAREQAAQAAHHEVQDVIERSKVTPVPGVGLTEAKTLSEAVSAVTGALPRNGVRQSVTFGASALDAQVVRESTSRSATEGYLGEGAPRVEGGADAKKPVGKVIPLRSRA